MSEPRFNGVCTGVTLILVGLVVTLVCAIMLPFAMMDEWMGFDGRNPWAGMAPTRVTGLVAVILIIILLAGVLSFVGKIFCLGAPSEMNGKSIIYPVVLFEGLSLLASVLFLVAPESLPPEIQMISSLVGLIALVLFVVFLRKLGQYLGYEPLDRQTSGLLITGAVAVGMILLGAVVAFAGASQMMGGLLMILGALVLLLFVIFYAVVLYSVRTLLKENYLTDRSDRADDYVEDHY